MAVNGINNLNTLFPSTSVGAATFEKNGLQVSEDKSVNFADFLNEAINKTNTLQIESEQIAGEFAAGKTDNIHQVMIAAEKADIALQFTMQIRTKILDAYNEIMRMQI